MRQLFAVIRTRGPAWQHGRPLEQQEKWTEHAAFMDALVDDGFVLLGGPLEGTSDVLLIIRAESPGEIENRLAADGGPNASFFCRRRLFRGRCAWERCHD